MYYNNEECVVYKDVIINDKKYTVVIENVNPETACGTDTEHKAIIYTLSVNYYCKMFNNDELVFHKTITRKEYKEYLSVIKEFCEEYKKEQILINKSLKEERLALKKLEEWDGIIK